MYLTNDDNSSTFVKNPLHKEVAEQNELNVNEMMNDPAKFQSPEESTMDSSMCSESLNLEPQVETKPCHWVDYTRGEASAALVEDLSIEIDVDDEWTLNSSFLDLSSCEDVSVQTPLSPEQVDVSCCEPGAIEVTVAWDSFNNMVTYVTPMFPAISPCPTAQRKRSRRRRKHRGKLLPASPARPMATWDVDFPLRRKYDERRQSLGVRSADI